MKPTHIKMLSTGYWHVRFGLNQFVQWPAEAEPTLSDVFGEPREEMLRAVAQVREDKESGDE